MNRKQLGRRIREEREKCGLTQHELADKLQWKSHATVVALESGDRELKAFELFQLSNILHMNVNDLYSESKTSPLVLWRKKPKAQRKLLERRFSLRSEEMNFLETILKDKLPQLRPLPRKELDLRTADLFWANELADSIRRELDLGSLPAATLFPRLEEEFGVRMFSESMGKDGSAACCYFSFGPAIFLNRDEVPWRQVFSIAHELFHLITWNPTLVEKVENSAALHRKNEALADAFAAGLLLPEDLLRRDVRTVEEAGKLSHSGLIFLARKYGVSTTAVLLRLRYLHYLSSDQLDQILNDQTFHALDKKSFGKAFDGTPAFGARFLRLAYRAYQAAKISRARLARLLETTLIDLPDFLSTHGFPEVGHEEFAISSP